MAEITNVIHLPLGALFVLTAAAKLCRAAGKPRGYSSIWLGMLFIGVTEVFSSAVAYRWVDHALGPGWGIVIAHAAVIVAVGFAYDAVSFIIGRGAQARVHNAALTVGALLVSVAPWIISAPTTVPPSIAAYPTYFDDTWQSTAHWLTVTTYLILRIANYINLCWLRVVTLREEGSLVTGLQVMCLAQVVAIAAISEALLFQGMWLLGRGPGLFALYVTSNAALLGLSVALLGASVGWPYYHQRWQQLTAHRSWSSSSRGLRLLHQHWSWLTAQMPEVTVFPEAVTGSPTSADQLLWQRSRIVTELYDAQRRLAPYYDTGDHQQISRHVAATGLPAAHSRAAIEHICLLVALGRYRAGAHAEHVRSNFIRPSLTIESTATRITKDLRLAREPATAAAITAAAREERR